MGNSVVPEGTRRHLPRGPRTYVRGCLMSSLRDWSGVVSRVRGEESAGPVMFPSELGVHRLRSGRLSTALGFRLTSLGMTVL